MLIRVVPQASEEQARACLRSLVEERQEDFAGLARLIGRPPGYLSRYASRGTPKRLQPNEQETLAAYFRVPPQRLGAPM
jgi:hypothetical protein